MYNVIYICSIQNTYPHSLVPFFTFSPCFHHIFAISSAFSQIYRFSDLFWFFPNFLQIYILSNSLGIFIILQITHFENYLVTIFNYTRFLLSHFELACIYPEFFKGYPLPLILNWYGPYWHRVYFQILAFSLFI